MRKQAGTTHAMKLTELPRDVLLCVARFDFMIGAHLARASAQSWARFGEDEHLWAPMLRAVIATYGLNHSRVMHRNMRAVQSSRLLASIMPRQLADYVFHLAVSPDGGIIYAAHVCRVCVYDAATMAVLHDVPTRGSPHMALSDDGSRLSLRGATGVSVLATDTMQTLRSYSASGQINGTRKALFSGTEALVFMADCMLCIAKAEGMGKHRVDANTIYFHVANDRIMLVNDTSHRTILVMDLCGVRLYSWTCAHAVLSVGMVGDLFITAGKDLIARAMEDARTVRWSVSDIRRNARFEVDQGRILADFGDAKCTPVCAKTGAKAAPLLRCEWDSACVRGDAVYFLNGIALYKLYLS